MSQRGAVPLCLPNNCRWDEQTGEYSKIDEDRNSLFVTEASLKMLKSIKGSYFDFLRQLFRLVFGMEIPIGRPLKRASYYLQLIIIINCFCVLAST